MAKKGKEKAALLTAVEEDFGEEFIQVAIENFMRVYGHKTVEDRAIPDSRDGLLPSQRRILWAMLLLNLLPANKVVKCARVVGDTMGKFHPHGDQSIYGSLVRMANLATPLIYGQGNFGSINDSPAAMRYTECRLHPNAVDLLLSPDTLPVLKQDLLVNNYDDTEREPVVFVSNLPACLLTANEGIAVGTTTLLPTFTLDSLRKTVRYAMARSMKQKKHVRLTARECADRLVFDSMYGGKVTSSRDDIAAMMGEGTGRITWVCESEWDEKGGYYSITGIPPAWNFDAKLKKFNDMNDVKHAREWTRRQDGEKVIEIRVYPKARLDSDKKEALKRAIEKELQSSVTYRLNVTRREKVAGDIVEDIHVDFSSTSVPAVINDWIEWRVGMQKRIMAAQAAAIEREVHLKGLHHLAVTQLDVLVAIVKRTFGKEKSLDINVELARQLKIEVDDAKVIWEIPLRRYQRMSAADIKADLQEAQARLKVVQKQIRQPFKSTLERLFG